METSNNTVSKVIVVAGTRPEAIKVAPVLIALRQTSLETRFLATAQHRQLLDTVVQLFDLRPDIDLDLMRPHQHPADVLSRAVAGIDQVLVREGAHCVLVQGDTVSALAGALAAFHRRIPVGHIEAGLRSHDLTAPFPEEGARRMVGQVARLHFAPTDAARRNLLAENVSDQWIHVTGNTIVDSLQAMRGRVRLDEREIFGEEGDRGSRLVLITLHRRETLGEPLQGICRCIRRLAGDWPEVTFVLPLHPNPEVGKAVRPILGGIDNVRLSPPMPYDGFVAAMDRSSLIVTDSGGIQEEAPSLGVPVVVVRDVTERMEAVSAGWATLVGTDGSRLEAAVNEKLSAGERGKLSLGPNPFGDGRAAERIASILESHLGTPRASEARARPQQSDSAPTE